MGCDGCRRLREPWTQCRPCAPRSEPPRCGNNGLHRKGGASPFRPGPGGISIQSPHNPHTITLTGPGPHRGKTEALADLPFAAGGGTPARPSYLLGYINPRGVFQRAVSGTRYTLSDPQVSDPVFLAVPRTLDHALCTWPRSCFWAFCPGPPNLTQRSRQTPTQFTTLI